MLLDLLLLGPMLLLGLLMLRPGSAREWSLISGTGAG
jgi:hypothetical protein